jgi:hypothetical protein
MMASMRSECKKAGCTKAVVNGWGSDSGLCSQHYFEQYGEKKGACKVDGCVRIQYARGDCSAHYHRLLNGWPVEDLSKPLGDWNRHHGERCSVAGCHRLASKKTLCELHYLRKARGVRLEQPLRKKLSHTMPEGLASYKTVHERLRRNHGPAAQYKCVDCGQTASDWSYQYGASDERRDEESGFLFSENQRYYVPRCRSCNLSYDKKHRDLLHMEKVD